MLDFAVEDACILDRRIEQTPYQDIVSGPSKDSLTVSKLHRLDTKIEEVEFAMEGGAEHNDPRQNRPWREQCILKFRALKISATATPCYIPVNGVACRR